MDAANSGHVLWAAIVVGPGSTLIWCRVCGRHAETRVKGLAKACPKRMTIQAATRINKIKKQMHPVLKNVRLSTPWKYTIKLDGPSNNNAASSSSGAAEVDDTKDAKLLRVVVPPNFDDPEAEDFWSDEEPMHVHTGEP